MTFLAANWVFHHEAHEGYEVEEHWLLQFPALEKSNSGNPSLNVRSTR